jgi:hypothetical protein
MRKLMRARSARTKRDLNAQRRSCRVHHLWGFPDARGQLDRLAGQASKSADCECLSAPACFADRDTRRINKLSSNCPEYFRGSARLEPSSCLFWAVALGQAVSTDFESGARSSSPDKDLSGRRRTQTGTSDLREAVIRAVTALPPRPNVALTPGSSDLRPDLEGRVEALSDAKRRDFN